MKDYSQAARGDRRPLLLTLAPSHYCERARWALDLHGIDYHEVRLAPGAHAQHLRRLRASTTSLPLLVFEDGSLCHGSDQILDWTGLAGSDPSIEQRLEQTTGPLIRQCLYAGLLADPKSGIREVLFRGTNPRHALVGRLAWPLMRRIMAAGMNAQPQHLPDLINQVDFELDWLDQVLAERGDHLVAGAFGRADLTVASLLAPIALPQVEPVKSICAGVRWPATLTTFLDRSAERPIIKWVTRAYATHRRV